MIEKLRELACKHFGVTMEVLNSCNRKADCVYARIAISKALHSKGYNIYEISNLINRKRSTILKHLCSFDDRYRFDYDFKFKYDCFIKEVE